MPRVEESIVIGRSPKEVWDFITDPINDTLWMSNVVEYEADWKEQPQVGDGTRRVARRAGRRCEMTCEVTEVVPGEVFAWRSVEAPFPFASSFRLDNLKTILEEG